MKVQIMLSTILAVCVIIIHSTRIITFYIYKMRKDKMEKDEESNYKAVMERKSIRNNNILSVISICIGYVYIKAASEMDYADNIICIVKMVYIVECFVFFVALWHYHEIKKDK